MADAAPRTKIKSPSDHENPSMFFLYKAALVTVFLVLVPLFPSVAPDFFNQTLHARSWELLQLIFVGIAVSYGLFSKKNDEPRKDNHSSKIDNAQSYLSKLLQVSSVSDDESESHTVIGENKFQALNSQYYRGEPVVVVAKGNPAVEEQNGVVSHISQKPLLLPVRSLKQRVPSPSEADSGDDRIKLKRFNTSSSRVGDFGRLNVDKVEEKEGEEAEKVVLRSPIPWRSRSGRMKMKESNDEAITSPSMEEQELNRSDQSRSFRSFRANPNSSSSSPKNLSPSTSLLYESQSKSGEDVVRKKNFTPPPPAPPPPPSPAFLRKSVLMKSNSSIGTNNTGLGSTKKALARSARSVPSEELNETEMDELVRFGVDQSRSFRSFRPNEKASMEYEMMQSYGKEEKKKEFVEKVLMDSADEDAESESDEFDEDKFGGISTSNVEDDSGRDVDKKADEFIAKFREQIRLQRIESIRRSTAQRAGKNSR